MALKESEVGVGDFVLLDEITLEKFMENIKIRWVNSSSVKWITSWIVCWPTLGVVPHNTQVPIRQFIIILRLLKNKNDKEKWWVIISHVFNFKRLARLAITGDGRANEFSILSLSNDLFRSCQYKTFYKSDDMSLLFIHFTLSTNTILTPALGWQLLALLAQRNEKLRCFLSKKATKVSHCLPKKSSITELHCNGFLV